MSLLPGPRVGARPAGAATIEALERRGQALTARLAQARQRLAEYERLTTLAQQAVARAQAAAEARLRAAQAQRDRLLEEARREGLAAIARAQDEAARLRAAAPLERQRLEEEARRLRQERARLAEEIATLAAALAREAAALREVVDERASGPAEEWASGPAEERASAVVTEASVAPAHEEAAPAAPQPITAASAAVTAPPAPSDLTVRSPAPSPNGSARPLARRPGLRVLGALLLYLLLVAGAEALVESGSRGLGTALYGGLLVALLAWSAITRARPWPALVCLMLPPLLRVASFGWLGANLPPPGW